MKWVRETGELHRKGEVREEVEGDALGAGGEDDKGDGGALSEG